MTSSRCHPRPNGGDGIRCLHFTGSRELVRGERESFVGGCRWQRGGLWVGSEGLQVGGGGS